jgi:molybdenum cofactor cytidylyltransferase
VAFAGELFSELIRLSGEGGARRLLARYPAKGVEVDDPGVLQDMAMGRDASRVRSQWAAL